MIMSHELYPRMSHELYNTEPQTPHRISHELWPGMRHQLYNRMNHIFCIERVTNSTLEWVTNWVFVERPCAKVFDAPHLIASQEWCSVVQRVAVRCSVLQCVAVCCIALLCFSTAYLYLQYRAWWHSWDATQQVVGELALLQYCCSVVAVCRSVMQYVAAATAYLYLYNHTLFHIQRNESWESQSCCSVLQCVAVCCTVLQCVAVCCSVMHCVAVLLQDSRNVLQCVAVLRPHTHICSITLDGSLKMYRSGSWKSRRRGSVLQRVTVLLRCCCSVVAALLQCVVVCCNAAATYLYLQHHTWWHFLNATKRWPHLFLPPRQNFQSADAPAQQFACCTPLPVCVRESVWVATG